MDGNSEKKSSEQMYSDEGYYEESNVNFPLDVIFDNLYNISKISIGDKLIHNNKTNSACIICGHNEVAGYNDVIVYNSNYVPAQNGKFYGYGNIYYTQSGHYYYCKKHYPFPNVLDD